MAETRRTAFARVALGAALLATIAGPLLAAAPANATGAQIARWQIPQPAYAPPRTQPKPGQTLAPFPIG